MKKIILVLIGVSLLLSCQQTVVSKEKHTFYRMDTVIEITLVLKKAPTFSLHGIRDLFTRVMKEKNTLDIEETWREIDSLLVDWETRFSQTGTGSEVQRVNTSPDSIIPVSPELAEMLSIGLRYGDTLDGMFDLTILPIKELWGFGETDSSTNHILPSADTIQKTLTQVDYSAVTVDLKNNTLKINNKNTFVDVGGIAKGFALREIGRLLDNLKYTDYIIVAGGDIIIRGKRPDGTPWRVGIKHPRQNNKLLGAFEMDSGSVVTSGDYERFYFVDGKRYHHIFNARTGYCCTRNQSLTIWSMDPIVADVLSTGLFCLSTDSIMAFVGRRPSLECVLVDSMGVVTVSNGWKNKVQLKD